MAKKNFRRAWHFIADDLKLGYNDRRTVEVGKKLPAPGIVQLCHGGMHASTNLTSAMNYVDDKQPILCRVIVEGEIDEDWSTDFNGSPSKICGRNRTVLWMKRLPKNVLKKALRGSTNKRAKDVAWYIGSWEKASWDHLRQAVSFLSRTEKRRVEQYIRQWAYDNGCPA